MSTPNFDTRYITPTQVDSKIAAQAVADAGQYQTKTLVYAVDYGLVGDGITDDYDHVQNALNAVASGGELLLPPGTIYLGKAGAGALRIPCLSRGITIRGSGKGSTILKLSAEVLRAFDLYPSAAGITFKGVRLRNFTVDANNIGPAQVGPATTIVGSPSIPNGANTSVTVASTTGWASKGLLYFPTTNTGITGRRLNYVRQSGTQILLLNYTGTDLTATNGDIITGATNDHVIVGTLMAGYATTPTNMNFSDILIEDIEAVNVPTIIGPALGSGTPPQNYRVGISIAPIGTGGPSLSIQNITIRRCEVWGGEAGFYVAGVGTAPNSNSPFIDNIIYEDLKHDTGIVPTLNYVGLNFMIGGNGYGDRATIRRCQGWNSGDVGVETDAMMRVIVEDTTIEDSNGGNFFSTNYNVPARSQTGPPSTTLNGAITSSATSITVTAVPGSIARMGYLIIGSEILYYTATSDTGLTVTRACGGSTASAASSGATVIFHEVERQSVRYFNCTSRHSKAALVGSDYMPKGFYQFSKVPYVNPPVIIDDCSYSNYIVAMGNQPGGGTAEGMHFQGELSSIMIRGLRAERHGTYQGDGTSFRRGVLMSFLSAGGIKTQARIFIKDVRLSMSGRLGAGSTPPAYAGIFLDNGDWLLDWRNVDMSMYFVGAQIGKTAFLTTAATSANRMAGKIEQLRCKSDYGDLFPVAVSIPAYPQTEVKSLSIRDVDLTEFKFSPDSTNSNYKPFVLAASAQSSTVIEGVRHALTVTSTLPATRLEKAVTVAASYTVGLLDEYIGMNVSAVATVTLPKATSGNSGLLPKLTLGRVLVIKDELGNAATYNITITPQSGETIDGATSKVLNVNWSSIRIRSTGAGWVTV